MSNRPEGPSRRRRGSADRGPCRDYTENRSTLNPGDERLFSPRPATAKANSPAMSELPAARRTRRPGVPVTGSPRVKGLPSSGALPLGLPDRLIGDVVPEDLRDGGDSLLPDPLGRHVSTFSNHRSGSRALFAASRCRARMRFGPGLYAPTEKRALSVGRGPARRSRRLPSAGGNSPPRGCSARASECRRPSSAFRSPA